MQTTYDSDFVVDAIYQAAAMFLSRNSFMPGIVTPFSGQGLLQRKGSRWNAMTYKAIATSDKVAPQKVDKTALSLDAPTVYSAAFEMADADMETDPDYTIGNISENAGVGLAQLVDSNLVARFSSFTGGNVGAAGSAITWDFFFAMRSLLDDATKGQGAKQCVLHSFQWHTLAAAAMDSGVNVTQPQWAANMVSTPFSIRQVDDVTIWVTSLIDVDDDDDAVAGMFVPGALALDTRKPFTVEMTRKPELGGGADLLVASAIFADGVWNADYGIYGTFDASTPTGA